MNTSYRSTGVQAALTCAALLTGCASTDSTIEGASEPLTLAAAQGVTEVEANGTGCPRGTWSADVAEDGSGFSIVFDNYEASVAESTALDAADCNLSTTLHVPSGVSYAVQSFSYEGYATLDDGVQARYSAKYYFQGDPQAGREVQSDRTGPYDDAFTYSDELETADVVWSPCGVDRTLNVQTRMVVTNNSEKSGRGSVRLDSAQESRSGGAVILRLNYRPCP